MSYSVVQITTILAHLNYFFLPINSVFNFFYNYNVLRTIQSKLYNIYCRNVSNEHKSNSNEQKIVQMNIKIVQMNKKIVQMNKK